MALYSVSGSVTSGANGGASSGFTTATDITGATWIAVLLSWYTPISSLSYFDCSQSNNTPLNTWVPLTAQTSANGEQAQWLYCLGPSTVTDWQFKTAGVSTFCSTVVLWGTGNKSIAAFDTENGAIGAAVSSLNTGTVTPAENNEMVLTGVTFDPSGVPTVSGYTDPGGTDNLTATHLGAHAGYVIQTTAGSTSATWVGSSNIRAVVIATFKSSTGGGSTFPNAILNTPMGIL